MKPLFQKAEPGWQTRWASFENPTAAKGAGATRNRGAKGFAYDSIEAGETKTLLDIDGSGLLCRWWITINDRSPQRLRELRIDAYWDGSDTPAISCPLGDFFAMSLGRTFAFDSELLASPEGRSFVCTIPMPFRTGARVTVTNESATRLNHFFYDIDLLAGVEHDDDTLYFHAAWRRERPNALGTPFAILPRVQGAGRFLGASLGVITDPIYGESWWGEGEVKAWLDGDDEHPTLCGTGTEDYPGAAWGIGAFTNRLSGCPIADGANRQYGFYRFHTVDPIYFHRDCTVAIDTIGGAMKHEIEAFRAAGASLIPISLDHQPEPFVRLFEHEEDVLSTIDNGWVNFFRCDDWCGTAYFYLDAPENGLPPLAPVGERTVGLLEMTE